ncbi:hypothetical protein DLAC_11613 [Tieghemostelium lacteum]|uniref:3-oxo-5-alpha-steroid 4-dehydrogenase C-terminal domain-containing protein n=1 Tax=Tieghemostelium lacteum TaxID=361077 RepID=A0A151ZI87_TIELA|nr:hypothetical protein DLAC_11613 [Tieghemostelium lacteum]|eukprot:KYQ93702.1 hypothetical protein DLAC_11613 [Tieghemostelium lacteum]
MFYKIILWISYLFWSVALSIYSIKLFSSSFNNVTAYGRLRPNTNQNDKSNDIISSTLRFLYLDREISIHSKYSWSILYFELITLSFSILIIFNLSIQSKLVFLCLLIQGIRRFIETMFIQKHTITYMNILQFISGIAFYVFVNISLLSEDITSHTTLRGNSDSIVSIISTILFIYSSFKQYQSHVILSNLRPSNNVYKSTQQQQQKPIYQIPMGGWFGYVSSPHYFAEILIYLSIVFQYQFRNLSSWFILIFVIFNLTERSIQVHQWYNNKFQNYPKDRYAIIPYLL